MASDDAERWVSISAAARALGISRPAVRGRIKRGTLETRQAGAGNRSMLQVRLPEGFQERHQERLPEPVPERLQEPGELAELRERAAAVEAVAVELRRELAEVRADVTDLRAERDRLLALIERITAKRTPPPRRPWPGLWAYLRRLVEGEGR